MERLVALASVPAKDAGIGSGIVNVSQQVAGVLSVAVLGAVSTSRTASLVAAGRSTIDALFGGYHLAFIVAMASVVLAIILGILLLKRPSGESGNTASSDETFEAESETMIAEIM
jgi:hypothetical protein